MGRRNDPVRITSPVPTLTNQDEDPPQRSLYERHSSPVDGNPEAGRAEASASYSSRDPDPATPAGPRPEICSCTPLTTSLRGGCTHRQFNPIHSADDEHDEQTERVEDNGNHAETENIQLFDRPPQPSNFAAQEDDFAHTDVHPTGGISSNFEPFPDCGLANPWAHDSNSHYGGEPDPPVSHGGPVSALGQSNLGGDRQYASAPTVSHGYLMDTAEPRQTFSSYQPGLPSPSQQHPFTFSTSSASYADPVNTTLHNHDYFTDFGHPTSPPTDFLVGLSGWDTQPTYATLSSNPPVTPLRISAGLTHGPSPNQGIDPSMIASTSTAPNLAANPTTPKPRKKGGPKPSDKTCSVCGQKFDRPHLLKDHMHIHTGVKRHICPICNKGCRSKSNLGRHHRRSHRGGAS